MKIDLYKFDAVPWFPKSSAGLFDHENSMIRVMVSSDNILYSIRDLDRLRGCTSNSSNTSDRYMRKEFYMDHWVKLKKKDCLGTPFEYSFRSSQMAFFDDYLANIVMERSNKVDAQSYLKIFRNGPQQKARLWQQELKIKIEILGVN